MQLRHLSDEGLVEEARAGSDAAFAALYVRYQRAVQARCFAVLRDHDEAADASQNAMLNALRALRRHGSPANPRGWLLTIAHNEAVSLMRRSRPSEPLEHGHGGAGPGADEGAFARERLRQLVDDLNALPDRQRGALLLREASGYSYRRIASALGTSTGNARQTVHQARRNLHKRRVGREHGWLGWALPGLAGAWLLRVLGLEELAAHSLNAGKAALLAGALVVGGGAASQVAGGGAVLGAATPSALAARPRRTRWPPYRGGWVSRGRPRFRTRPGRRGRRSAPRRRRRPQRRRKPSRHTSRAPSAALLTARRRSSRSRRQSRRNRTKRPTRRWPQRRPAISVRRARSRRSRPPGGSLRRSVSPTVPKGRAESYPRRSELPGDRQPRSLRTRDLAAAAGPGARSGAEAEARSRARP